MINKSGLYTILMNCGVSLQMSEPPKGKALGCDWLNSETCRIQQIQHFRTSVRVLQLRSAGRRQTLRTGSNWASSLLTAGDWYF